MPGSCDSLMVDSTNLQDRPCHVGAVYPFEPHCCCEWRDHAPALGRPCVLACLPAMQVAAEVLHELEVPFTNELDTCTT